MRKPFLLSLLVALLTSLSIHADRFQSGDLYYNITSDTTVEVTFQYYGGGNYQGLTTATLPETVTYNGTTYSVTSIGGEAFSSCSSLTSITLPNSVTSIRGWAFWGCSSLTSITIPNSVTSIGSGAFYDCLSLTSITLPYSVTSIRDDAFYGCTSLTKTNYTGDITSWCNIQFTNYSANPISFSKNLYLNDVLVTDLVIPQGVIGVGDYAFIGCSSLTSITLPNSVTSIGGAAFAYCSSLTSITLPTSVTSIGFGAFEGCSSLTSITLPNSVTSIGDGAFYGCSSFTSITLPNSVTSIGGSAFAYCSSLTSITLPNSVTSIGDESFKSCSALTSITLSNSVTSIGNNAFRGCSSLTSLTLPNSVTSIGSSAFEDCSSLTSIILPNSITSIGEWAFEDCSSLTSVTSLSCTPPSCGYDVFSYTPSEKTLVVPSISMDAYKNSSTWKDFTSFEKCLSVFVLSSDSTLGVAQIDQEVDCDSVAIISAVGNLGSAFTQWSDGNTDNPRTIKLTQDTTFVAEFEMDYSGKCGDELYWVYSNQEIKITGTGAMYNYTDSTMPWTLLRDSIKTVRVGNNATSIGAYAFANTPKLAELHIGINVEEIGANAFAGCKRLYDIYCYPTYPPFAEGNSFANYNVYVYLPCESQRDYTLDVVWGEFKFIECIGSENVVVSGNEVTVSPDYEDATFTWPVTDNADTYSLVITKDGVTFCTLVFNAQGQLASIAFKPRRQNAPAAEGTTPATYAEMTANGFRFTVTGLDEGSAYAYTLTVRSAANTVLETYTGEFTTLSNTPMGINESAGEDAHAHGQVEKILHDGQVLILRNGKTYNMMGQTL